MRAEIRAAFRALALSVVALSVLALGARAGEQSIEVDGLRVTVTTSWPSTLNRGWQPARVEIANPGDEREVSLRFTCSSGPSTDVVTREVRVPRGGVERFEVLLPARPETSNAYALMVSAGQRGYVGAVGAEQSSPAHERVVLLASRAGPSTVDVAAWASALSKESDPRVVLAAAAFRRGHIGMTYSMPPGVPGSAGPEHVRVGGIAFESLSPSPEAYTSLHALVLDVGDGTPPARAELDAIESWVRTGGVLALVGAGAPAFVAKEPALAAWAEPRFLVHVADGASTYACALGLLLVAPDAAAADVSDPAVINAAIEARAPYGANAPHSAFDVDIPGIQVPYRSLTLLLVLFAILVGPVNLILVRRSGRPALLLLTIPAIAIVFSLGLVLYGAAAQGLDVRATSISVGVLDQRTHHGSSHERRQVFAGLAAGPGLRPGPGAVVERPLEAIDWSNRREFLVDTDSGLTLSGAWMPVRTPTNFHVTVDRAARGRVDFERTADGWKLTNGLDATVRNALFRDAEGALHAFGPVVAGRSLVVPDAEPDAIEIGRFEEVRVLGDHLLEDGFVPRNAWLAIVDDSPLLDPCGLEYDVAIGKHYLLGILEHTEPR